MTDRDNDRATTESILISLRAALLLFILLRVALSAYAVLATVLVDVPPPCFHHGVIDWTSMPVLYSNGLEGSLLGVWQRWDACWYLRLAEFGYEPGEPGTAFFPVYPTAIRLLGPFFLGNLTLAALVVSGIGYVTAMTVLHAMVTADLGRAVAERSMVYISVFPTAFFLFAPFTESTFLALALLAIYLARSRRFWWAVIPALLVGLTRPQGFLVALPLAWEALRVLRAHRLTEGHRLQVLAAASAAVAPMVGFLAFVLYSEAATGVSVFEAGREHWGYALAPPWDVLARAWDWMLDPANAAFANIQALTAFHLILIALFIALFAIGIRRLPPTYSMYVAPQLLVILSGGPATPLQSASRFMVTMFPIFVVAALLGANQRFHLTWVVMSAFGLAVLLLSIITNVPVG